MFHLIFVETLVACGVLDLHDGLVLPVVIDLGHVFLLIAVFQKFQFILEFQNVFVYSCTVFG